MKTLRHDLLVAAVLVTIGVLGRWVAHAPNATPVAAAGLLAGCVMGRRWLAMLVPLATLAISDVLFRGGYDPLVMLAVYGTFAGVALGGRLLDRRQPTRVLAGSLLASLLFFLTTNLAVWVAGTMYSPTWAGLGQCYVNALPFLRNTVRGDLWWCGVLFGGLAALEWVCARIAGTATKSAPAEVLP